MGRRGRSYRRNARDGEWRKRRARWTISTVLALVFVLFIVPWSFGISTALNDALTGTVLNTVDTAADVTALSKYGEVGAGDVVYGHLNESTIWSYEDLEVYWPADLGTDYAQVIVTATDTTQDTERGTVIMVRMAYEPQDWIDQRVTALQVTMRYSSAKTLMVAGCAYAEGTSALGSGGFDARFQLSGIDGTDYKYATGIYDTMTSAGVFENATHGVVTSGDAVMNLTSTVSVVAVLPVSEISVLKADTYFGTSDGNASFQFALSMTGDTDATSIIVGDYLKFKIEVLGSATSGTQISEWAVGILGAVLIIGSAMISPVWNPSAGGKRMRGRASRSRRARR